MTFQIQSKKILLIAIVFLFTLIMQITAGGIACFKCYASQSGHEKTDLLCSHFDGSPRFQVYCPSSTLCGKRTIYSKFKTPMITTVERDCAPQKRTVLTYSDNKWQNREEIVTSAYKEGCFIGEDRGAPAGPSEYCFCGHHLCNSSEPTKTINMFYIFILITVLLFATLL
ncbi:uncharacterized protein LOC117237431 isoform X1 [Bombus vosnesenskii]|uniref:Uncharacterized protein LOC117237431 isoform X1 n=3 Tax=Pyrobombus TaxID=144703 RepID=A0A6J3KZL3_9HYME|nr:uncharacterized protein LOC100743786 isoform X1 [Bombus impatiens]XP_033198078.1 uncharacterized protein LOC117161005 isoform X1 [Bombus vancouverensis nearcticus]XP_033302871.1 uncharacterized protein LOC117207103 isoform X1 [Bombus bifarius]XP_033357284.1 uncharacterized protein LOC117237431 isoform X1 [Bombus vosnesenskii]XP_050469434.1 uncharacterized protein LOC126863379 isoform X1 [Bombus huntii]